MRTNLAHGTAVPIEEELVSIISKNVDNLVLLAQETLKFKKTIEKIKLCSSEPAVNSQSSFVKIKLSAIL